MKLGKKLFGSGLVAVMSMSFVTGGAMASTGSNDVDINIEPGEFLLSTSGIGNFEDVVLDDAPQTYETSFESNFNVKDLTGAQDGWRLDVSASPFSVLEPEDGFGEEAEVHQLPNGSLSLSPLDGIDRVEEGEGTSPTSQMDSDSIIDDGTVTVASANQGEGMGVFDIDFSSNALSLVVDATTAKMDTTHYSDGATPYGSTLSWDLVQAP